MKNTYKKYTAIFVVAILFTLTGTHSAFAGSASTSAAQEGSTYLDQVRVRASWTVTDPIPHNMGFGAATCPGGAGNIEIPITTLSLFDPAGVDVTMSGNQLVGISEACLVRGSGTTNTVTITSDDATYSAELASVNTFSLPDGVAAPTTADVQVIIVSRGTTIYNNTVTTSDCLDGYTSGNMTRSAWCAIYKAVTDAGWSIGTMTDGSGIHITGIDGYNETGPTKWIFSFNDTEQSTTVGQVLVNTGDRIRVELPLPQAHVIVRYGGAMMTDTTVSIPTSQSFDYQTPVDSTPTPTSTQSFNVLNALIQTGQDSSAFSVSQILYYESFNSLFVNCLKIEGVDRCGSWQYAVNGTSPVVSADKWILQGGENVYFYFSDEPFRLTADATDVTVGDTVAFQSQRYPYAEGGSDYISDENVRLSFCAINPWCDTLSPDANALTVLTTDPAGGVVYQFNATGTYYVRIDETDGSKWSNPITIQVNDAVPTTPPSEPGNSTNVGSSPSVMHQMLNVDKAVQFLVNNQQADGSFGSVMYSDWIAIALGGVNNASAQKALLAAYLKADPSARVGMNMTADYERRAMALLALGINPYTGTATNYIQKIIDSFDGTQFGDANLYNDDIFALIPLLRAGYSANDSLIASSTAFILSKQGSNGAWGEVDQTAAAIQALTPLTSLPGVTQAIERAKMYLHTSQTLADSIGDNTDSTSWAMQAIGSLGEDESISWMKNNKTPSDYLAAAQQTDGGVGLMTNNISTRLWSTSFAISAALHKPWTTVLSSVAKDGTVVVPPPATGTTIPNPVTLPTPTTTLPMTTTTLDVVPTTTIVIAPTDPKMDIEKTVEPVELSLTSPVVRVSQTPQTNTVEKTLSSDAISEDETSTSTDETSSSTEEVLSINTESNTPTSNVKKVLIVASTAAGGFGLYLGWRFLQSLV